MENFDYQSILVDSGSIVQCDELDKDQNNQHGDFNIYPQCVELGKDDGDEDSKKELEDNYCEKKGISTSQGDELGRSVRVPGVP